MATAEYMREYRRKNPEKCRAHVRNSQLKAKYGITTKEYEALLESQGNACASCKCSDNGGRKFTVDHDHDTGKVRGILCLKCNTALGLLGDSPYLVTALLQYLDKVGN